MSAAVVKCETCGQLMAPDSSCWPVVIDAGGAEYSRIRFGGAGDWPERWAEGPCRDCNVLPGKVHHWGCDQEVCPKCGAQMLMCRTEGPCGWDTLAERVEP